MSSRIHHSFIMLTWLVLLVGITLDAGGPATADSIPAVRRTVPTVNTFTGTCKHVITPIKDPGSVVLNTATGLSARIDANGFSLETTDPDRGSGNWSTSLGLVHVGRPGNWILPSPNASITQWGDSVRTSHFGFDVEYINSAAGLRQNFIVHERPLGEGPLHVELKPAGDLRCEHVEGDLFRFIDSTEVTRMTYSDLHVWDADGDTLEAFASMEDGLVVLAVCDKDADYPVTIDPLATTAIWSTESNLANALLGTSASSAGDVNGDGYSDILIGTPGWINGEVGEGRVQLHYGSATGPSVGITWSFETNQVGANLGLNKSVATAGDVNGDGYSDIIVGAPYFDNGETNEGRVFAFYGSASGLSATPDWTAESNQANALFGYVVNCAGDVNGDGYSDVVVGAHQFDNGESDEGGVFVYYGSATGLSATPNWTAESNQVGARFGTSVASAGDVNGDGYSDLIVGAPVYDNGQTNEGRAFVYHGSASGLSIAANWTTESNQANSQTSFAVSSAGDTNNDGYSDVVVGIPFYASILANDGRVVIHRGSASGLSVVANQTIDATVAQMQFGKAVSCAGDVDGNGYADIIVGSPNMTGGQTNEGQATVYAGRAGPLMTRHWSTSSGQANALMGTCVNSAGDVNGDGYSDVVIGTPQYDNGQNNEGRASIYTGSASSSLGPGWTQTGPHVGSLFGRRVASAGDVNGDGYGDVIIGAELFGSGEPNEGGAFLYHGSATGLPSIPNWTGQSNVPSAQYGFSVASAGDVNGDGYSDIIIGAPYFANGQTDEGRFYVYHGSSAGLSPTPAFSVEGNATGAFMGNCVGGAGDVNADGYSDVIVGAAGGLGYARVYFGSATGITLTGSQLLTGTINTHFGESVAGAGDVNGDGYSDVIIGANSYNSSSGAAYVFHGSASGLNATPAWTKLGTQVGAQFGANTISGPASTTAGDVNGDGFSDVIIGEPYYDGGQPDEGRVVAYYGSPTGLYLTPNWAVESNVPNLIFGTTIRSAGDVDGDGYSDVVIGACTGFTTGAGEARFFRGAPTGLTTTPSWTNAAGEEYGHSVSGAGDVNGDGFSDVLVGDYSAISSRGVAFLYFGGASAGGARNNLRLYNTDLASPISATNIPVPQFGAGLFTRPFLGRTRTRLAWETRIQGEAFSSAATFLSRSVEFTDEQVPFTTGAIGGVELKTLITKPGGGTGITATKLRTRVRYDPVTAITGQVYGPWRYMPGYLDGNGTHNNIPLPVELLYFNATCIAGSTRLDWATASEHNSSHFIIQRSTDTFTWNDIGSVHAAGQSQQVTEYTFLDPRPATDGTTYYRALQFDQDGSANELPVVTSEPCSGSGGIRLYPNPTEGTLFVDLSAMKASASTLLMLDASGRIQMKARVEDIVQRLNLASLASGSYVLQVLDERGEVLGIEQVIRNVE